MMIVRMLFAAVAGLLATGMGAHAQDSSGMIVCEQDVRAIGQYLENNRAQLSPESVASAQQQLDLARDQCSSSPQTGLNTVASLRHDLGMQLDTQTAQQPGETPQPQGQ